MLNLKGAVVSESEGEVVCRVWAETAAGEITAVGTATANT